MGWGARGRAARAEGGPQNRGGWDCDPALGGDSLEQPGSHGSPGWEETAQACRAPALTRRALWRPQWQQLGDGKGSPGE